MIAAIGGITIAITLMMIAAVVEKNWTTPHARMISVRHGIMIEK